MGNYLSIMGQSLEHNRIKNRELENSIIGKNWSIMWQGLFITHVVAIVSLKLCGQGTRYRNQ